MTEAHDAGPSPAFVYTCIALWIANSTVCMLLNKYVLHYLKFAFPSVLAVMHMFAAAVLTTFLVHANYDSGVPTISALGPRLAAQLAGIACMFGLVLLLSNTAFEYLSVPTIQMLKVSLQRGVFPFLPEAPLMLTQGHPVPSPIHSPADLSRRFAWA
jgi:hypothetical protein